MEKHDDRDQAPGETQIERGCQAGDVFIPGQIPHQFIKEIRRQEQGKKPSDREAGMRRDILEQPVAQQNVAGLKNMREQSRQTDGLAFELPAEQLPV